MEMQTPTLEGGSQALETESEAPLPINERIAILKRRRKELTQIEEERELQLDIEQRERRLNEEIPLEPPLRAVSEGSPSVQSDNFEDGDEERPARRRRVDGEFAAIPGRGPKIEKIPMFEGKGIREYYDFESRLKIAFRLDPQAFTWEDQKIAFTLQYLQPTFRQLWIQRELEVDGEELEWRQMMSFLLDQIQSPVNRELQVTLQYQRASQKEGQTVNEFAAYLATLENQINPPYEQKHLVMHLYSKLRPELRVALANYAEFPKTRRELVERAATLEDNQRKPAGLTASHRGVVNRPFRTVTRSTPTRPIATPSSSRITSRAIGKLAEPRRVTTCNYCHKIGHWEKDCWMKQNARVRQSTSATGANALKAKN